MLLAAHGNTLFSDVGNSYKSGSTLTTDSPTYYNFGSSFPGPDGDSSSANPYDGFTCSTGQLIESGGKIYTGTVPATDKYFFRCKSRSWLSPTNVRFSFTVSYDAFSSVGVVEAGDAFDVWLGHQDQWRLYALQIIRRGSGTAPDTKGAQIILKHKVPCNSYTGPGGNGGNIANSGVYYYVKTEASAGPVGNQNTFLPTYAGAGLSAMQDNGTSYNFVITKQDIGGGDVRITATRDGVLVASWVDDGTRDHSPASLTNTSAGDLAAGYFTGTTGYNAANYVPLVGPGRIGWRSDNLGAKLSNIKVEAI